jgi:hypothetical protein
MARRRRRNGDRGQLGQRLVRLFEVAGRRDDDLAEFFG